MKTLFRVAVIMGLALLVVWALVAIGGQRLLLPSSLPRASNSPEVLVPNGQGLFTAAQSAPRSYRDAILISFERTLLPIIFVIVLVGVAGRALSSQKPPRKPPAKAKKPR